MYNTSVFLDYYLSVFQSDNGIDKLTDSDGNINIDKLIDKMKEQMYKNNDEITEYNKRFLKDIAENIINDEDIDKIIETLDNKFDEIHEISSFLKLNENTGNKKSYLKFRSYRNCTCYCCSSIFFIKYW